VCRFFGLVVVFLAVLAGTPSCALGDPTEFAAIDAHARAAPGSAAASVESLAAYLSDAADAERGKVRAAFAWIAHNIAYDLSRWGVETDSETVLADRRAACVGYATLFETLVEHMGLEAEIIWGHGKGRGYLVGEPISEAGNHAWNAVKIGGKWALVDCTWGAGWVNDEGRFVKSLTEHYFLTSPGEFVNDHFPDDPKWQLLPKAVSAEEYLSRPRVKPPFYQHGLRLISHDQARIRVAEAASVVVGASTDVVLSASLHRDGRRLDDRYTFVQREADNFDVYAAFPGAGSYVLRIFAGKKDGGGELEWAVDYAVESTSRAQGTVGFPKTYGAFLTRDCYLDRPVTREIAAGEAVEFSLSAPGARDVMVLNGGAGAHLAAEDGRFSGAVTLREGEVRVFAKFPGKTRYEALLEYDAR
jgi:hypothetical protein